MSMFVKLKRVAKAEPASSVEGSRMLPKNPTADWVQSISDAGTWVDDGVADPSRAVDVDRAVKAIAWRSGISGKE